MKSPMFLIAGILFLMMTRAVPNVRAADHVTIINTIPGITAWSETAGGGKQVSDEAGNPFSFVEAVVTAVMSFGTVDGTPKTTFPNLEREADTLGGLFDNEKYRGGSLMPLSLQQQLVKPQNQENSDLVEQYPSKFCSSFSGKPAKKKVNEQVPVSEPYKSDTYDTGWALRTISAINGTSPETTVQFYTPPQELFRVDETTGNRILKEDLYDPKTGESAILFDCGAESTRQRVADKLLNVYGIGQSSAGLPISASREDIVQFLTGIAGCTLQSKECARRVMALSTTLTTSVVSPMTPVMNAMATGEFQRSPAALPHGVPADSAQELKTHRGVFNIFYPEKLIKKLRTPYDQSHAATRKTSRTEIFASPGELALSKSSTIPHAGLSAVKKRFQDVVDCAIMPLALQNNCDNLPADTSDWAQGDPFSGMPLDHAAAPFTGDFGTLLTSTAQKIGLPACVLDGVALIEGGSKMSEIADINTCLASVNSCSAAGPMQFTTGQDAYGNASCSDCPSAWVQENGCPNAWATWGKGGNPCLYKDSLRAAAKKLKNDGALTDGDPTKQQTGIEEAGYRYYGSRKPVGRLGGLSYGQFLFAHCQAHPNYDSIIP